MTLDAHIPTMSLPLAMGTRFGAVPADIPYLSVPPEAAAKWGKILGPRKRRRIGLAWAGNPTHKNDHARSIKLQAILPLLDADAEFHSLLIDYREGDQALLKSDGRIIDHAEDLKTFSDTAALIEAMDMVIAVDTSSAHLAGALGKPLLLLLPFVPDYRWGLERADTPWYPTARLLRQKSARDWGPVIAEAAEILKA